MVCSLRFVTYSATDLKNTIFFGIPNLDMTTVLIHGSCPRFRVGLCTGYFLRHSVSSKKKNRHTLTTYNGEAKGIGTYKKHAPQTSSSAKIIEIIVTGGVRAYHQN